MVRFNRRYREMRDFSIIEGYLNFNFIYQFAQTGAQHNAGIGRCYTFAVQKKGYFLYYFKHKRDVNVGILIVKLRNSFLALF